MHGLKTACVHRCKPFLHGQAPGEGPQACEGILLTGNRIMEWPGLGCSEQLCPSQWAAYFPHGSHHYLLCKSGIAQYWETRWGKGSHHEVTSEYTEEVYCIYQLYFSRRRSAFKDKSQNANSCHSRLPWMLILVCIWWWS